MTEADVKCARLDERLTRVELLLKSISAALSQPVTDIGRLATIQTVVAKNYSLDLSLMLSRSRVVYVAWPRMISIYIARCLLPDLPLAAIDARTHVGAGVSRYAFKTVLDRSSVEPKFAAEVQALLDRCRQVLNS